jgi:hypothetical protein
MTATFDSIKEPLFELLKQVCNGNIQLPARLSARLDMRLRTHPEPPGQRLPVLPRRLSHAAAKRRG